ncbi:MAG: Flp pilus assembly complex ATPase component [Phycisphaeraceae bacterium]|nr:Flp pilus assembly complex ATPase component [Phycisphaeraceae bacterium]MCP4496401.1 Flp pilus assembly complex ATPase component [Phycisphaeraceae bacterium]MCP4797585.1 Flp pilus assembly complex ATPase component [Phycisphaeraceae bacterium]MCP4938698.1 Flp pilus assembly complex ATPase component [Phycisphaeraceae bacterium]
MKGRKFGRVLVKLGKVTREQVHEALKAQQGQAGRKVGEILVDLGYITDDDIRAALAGQAGIEQVVLRDREISDETFAAIPATTATTYQIVPIKFDRERNAIAVAVKSPDNFAAVDDLRNLLGFKRVKPVLAAAEEIDEILQERYAAKGSGFSEIYAEAGDSAAIASLEGRGDSLDLDMLEEASGDNAIVRLVQETLLIAIRDKASDIHFEPFEDEFKIRYRIDGVLYEMAPPDKRLALPIVSRIKVMSKLDIAERRLPQDGRIEMSLPGTGAPIDLRVAVLPTMFGESVVLRVLDRSNVQLSLDRVGLRDDDLERVRGLINKPNGIVLVTGPTGSGKTTTLYAALTELNTPDRKILTAEDPVEYDIDGLIQCQVNVDQELTFSKLLRSFLRQDPDTILVGEIRDLETAQIAIQASLTGHLVFSTLHTNDAPSSILRLIDLGVESFLLTATLEAIVAQRLIRKICEKCKEEFVPTEEQLMELSLLPADVEGRTFFRGRGCGNCMKTGYKGRMAIFEIMTLDDTLREMIMSQASTAVLRDESRRRGMRTLRESGLLAIYEGQSTIEEVVRETIAED